MSWGTEGTPESRAEALALLVQQTIAALGDEKSKPFEIEAYWEYVDTDSSTSNIDRDIHPRIKLIKK